MWQPSRSPPAVAPQQVSRSLVNNDWSRQHSCGSTHWVERTLCLHNWPLECGTRGRLSNQHTTSHERCRCCTACAQMRPLLFWTRTTCVATSKSHALLATVASTASTAAPKAHQCVVANAAGPPGPAWATCVYRQGARHVGGSFVCRTGSAWRTTCAAGQQTQSATTSVAHWATNAAAVCVCCLTRNHAVWGARATQRCACAGCLRSSVRIQPKVRLLLPAGEQRLLRCQRMRLVGCSVLRQS